MNFAPFGGYLIFGKALKLASVVNTWSYQVRARAGGGGLKIFFAFPAILTVNLAA